MASPKVCVGFNPEGYPDPKDMVIAMKGVCYDIHVMTPKSSFLEKGIEMDKRLLHEVNFYAEKGTCNAIIGRSGSGKTTMLDIIAGVKVESSGQVYCSKGVAYVAQASNLYATQTVRETFEFAAALKLPSSVSKEEQSAKVNEIIGLLGLSEKADSLIQGGDGARSLSGGETRRVYVGRELVSLPTISDVVLLLDEPTTGLDAANSRQLVALLCSLAKTTGSTIVMSVHNLRFSSFSLFRSVTVIDKGYLLYFGVPSKLTGFLHDLGLNCPENENIADFVIDVLSEERDFVPTDVEGANLTDSHSTELTKDENPAAYEENRPNKKTFRGGIRSPNEDTSESDTLLAMHKQISPYLEFEIPNDLKVQCRAVQRRNTYNFNTTMSLRLYYVILRNVQNVIRRPTLFRVSVITSITKSLLMVLLYYKQPQSVEGLQNLSGLIFFSLVTNIFSNSYMYSQLLIEEVGIFREEGKNHYYRPAEFLIAKVLVQSFFLILIPTIIYCSILYYAVGFRLAFQYFLFFNFSLYLTGLGGYAFINIILLLCGKRMTSVGIVLYPLLLSIMILWSGLFVRTESMAPYLAWIIYLSIFHLGYGPLILNEVVGREYACLPSSSCTEVSGRDFISLVMGFELLGSKWYYISILFGYIILFGFITYWRLFNLLK